VQQDAGARAELLGRADARTAAAEQVRVEDQASGGIRPVLGDRRDERGNVDPGRAAVDTRSACPPAAFEAPIGLEQRFPSRQWGVQLGEDGGALGRSFGRGKGRAIRPFSPKGCG